MYPKKEKQVDVLYTQSFVGGKHKYFIDVRQTRGGDKFITLLESRKIFNNETGQFTFEKNKIYLYKEDIERFQDSIANAIHFIQTGELRDPNVSIDFGEEIPAPYRSRSADTSDDDQIEFEC